MPDYSWPPMNDRKVMGKRISRVDGVVKASGRAKYSSDLTPKGLLYTALVTCPHAHARVTSIDVAEAEKSPGVKAVEVVSPAGTEIQWAGWEVAYAAAPSEQQARDAVRKIKVEYEVLPHLVNEADLAKAGANAKPAGEKETGDPTTAFQQAAVVSEGHYGIPSLTHCCLQSHGQVIAYDGQKMEYYPSTQSVSSIGGDLAQQLKIPATSIHVHQDHIGGGFGSKFNSDRWAVAAANISKKAGGAPVLIFLDRAPELEIAGNRPSAFANVKVAADKTGLITAWESESWASGGISGGGSPPIPYVFTEIPNQRLKHSAVSLNVGPQRAWRAPNHPQASYLTCAAIDDLAAKLKMDPTEVFDKNFKHTAREETYRGQLVKAIEMSEWKKRWHARGDSGSGPVKRGMGMGVGTWGGAGHASQCRTTINPDGSVTVELGSQDLGTGTRTIINQVAAESLGLQLRDVSVKIGDNSYPVSGSSGGSTTVGGVSSSTRKSTLNALDKLFEAVAPALGATPDQLMAADGKIQVKGNSAKSLTWKAACQKLGVKSISEMGENNPREARREGLNTGGVGGVQIADVSVDTETGVVSMNRLVAVHDCGLIINPKLAESQVYGACIMAICGALYEERIMDDITGRMLNAEMEFYKLAGAADIGEILVHMDIDPEDDKRGVVGLGEPPVIPGLVAICNAVTNAIGVRVPIVPMTPQHVLAALERRNA
jgi:xanthine dehydrogenase YagR molybdenum-binding subunit